MPLFLFMQGGRDLLLDLIHNAYTKALIVLGSDMPMSAPAFTDSLPFPQANLLSVDSQGSRLCRRQSCRFCAKSPYCAAVHSPCFAIYIKHCGLPIARALSLLHTTILFRSPWARMPHLHLIPYDRLWDMRNEIASIPGLAGLRTLPLEILDIIKKLSPQAFLWRFISALGFARRATSSTQLAQTLALQDIERWNRGGPDLAISDGRQTAIRITIDSDGIQEIERLHKVPAYLPDISRHNAFIVEDAGKIRNTTGYLKVIIPPYPQCLGLITTRTVYSS